MPVLSQRFNMACEIYGAGVYGPYFNAGAPVAGSNAVQTLTIGGTPTGGTFTLTLEGISTAAITWVNVNATLLASINAALDAKFGTSQIVATAGTLTAGIGTILLTFSGSNYSRRVVTLMTASSSLTGTSPTLAIATTTAGVAQTLRGAATGALLVDVTNGQTYQYSGSAWGKIGLQS